ncbi:sulfite oxidase heme-binding subunit YedZ [Teredinibacter haidensis]|uniref:sulfite oxidase heme-binding subunit YedZ n=1 Tax=Teredinibacter haidensis TaxID=2731755 RepID=UPI00094900FC|nr:protein-methionine-sulfoxide reductase heme-binding subunit MsrQ [Teredinibacter haidensis]
MPLRPFTFITLLIPLLLLSWQFFNRQLGANPVEALTHETGKWAFICLLLSLSATPIKSITGVKKVMQLRRMTGLYAFFYACLHFTIYWVFDQSLSLQYVWDDIIDRPYITLGFSAWLLLIPLTITSTKKMRKKLGRQWLNLHKLVYLIALLAIAHYIWLIRADYAEVIIYSIWLTALLGHRLYKSFFIPSIPH